jgi:hypothetical protein
MKYKNIEDVRKEASIFMLNYFEDNNKYFESLLKEDKLTIENVHFFGDIVNDEYDFESLCKFIGDGIIISKSYWVYKYKTTTKRKRDEKIGVLRTFIGFRRTKDEANFLKKQQENELCKSDDIENIICFSIPLHINDIITTLNENVIIVHNTDTVDNTPNTFKGKCPHFVLEETPGICGLCLENV